MNLTRRKAERGTGTKTRDLTRGRGYLPFFVHPSDRRPFREEPFEQSHGLKELEPVRLVEEFLRYSRFWLPALGVHRLNSPSRCLVRTTSWLNELIEA